MGVLQLKHIDQNIEKRRQITLHYRKLLASVPGIRFMNDIQSVKHCYPYFPVFIDEAQYGKSRDDLYEKLKTHNIFVRRYFYPLISQFPTYRGLESALPGKLPVAERITEKVICLPLYPELDYEMIHIIADLIKNSQ
jgi:dTDP-4-amino-4,6-dideoxygalactose transaminase